jgi:hypothetical protein
MSFSSGHRGGRRGGYRPSRFTPQPPPPPSRELHPLEQAVKAKIEKVHAEMQAKEQEYRALTQDLKKTRLDVFKEKYNQSAEDVLREYSFLLSSCMYQGGRGYHPWLPGKSGDHMVVHPDKYIRAQPTLTEKDAYYAVYGTDMIVTKEQHMEVWGN